MNLLRALLILYIIPNFALGQDAIHNYGNLQMHDNALVGFHTDVINDGIFDNNLGLAGFYGNNKSLSVSGTNIPIFNDAEIAVDDGIYLYTSIGVLNNGNLLWGDIITPRNDTNIYTNFINDAFYNGENDAALIDGYAGLTNKSNFTFPVGDGSLLRPLSIQSTQTNSLAKCAYFFESPNTPSTFGKSYETTKKETEFLAVSDLEFWHLQGNIPSTVTLTWNKRSNVRTLGETIEDLNVVGWHKENNVWVNLGNTAVEGTMNTGIITSDSFTPDEYELITIGGVDMRTNNFQTIQLDNYFISPNGDGINDYLVLEGIENSPNNELKVFNRYGVMVYSELNYQNKFNGKSNRKTVISRDNGLPAGVYFYIITMYDLRQRHQGYMYITTTDY